MPEVGNDPGVAQSSLSDISLRNDGRSVQYAVADIYVNLA
jgi:hypothetical protein